MRIAVVGAGWSGLAAAVTAVEAGHQVSLYEASRTAGGRARALPGTLPDGTPATLDNGQHILIGAYSHTLALMRTVGVAPEQALLRLLPSARPRIGTVASRKVDKLSTVRVCSARYSVPSRLVGQNVDVVTHDNNVRVYDIAGCLVAEHCQCGPGETSIPSTTSSPSRSIRPTVWLTVGPLCPRRSAIRARSGL